MDREIGGSPIGIEGRELARGVGLVARVGWRGLARRDSPGDVDHGLVGPPTLSLVADRFDGASAVEQTEIGGDGRPSARFAEVVDAGPQELAGVGRIVAQRQPHLAAVLIFGADDLARRLLAVGGEDLVFAIVLPDDVQQVGEAVVVVVTHVGPEQRLRDGPGRVGIMERGDQTLEDPAGEIGLRRVADFIAGAIENDAGVVAVAEHGIARVCLGPLTEIEVVVAGVFGHRPHIEHLVHHQESHAVAEVEEFGGDRVVGGTDGVHAELLEGLQAPFPGADRDGGAECAGVAMKADPFDFEVTAVEPKAGIRVEVEFADTERNGLFVKAGNLHYGAVERAVVEVPELRGADSNLFAEGGDALRRNVLELGGAGRGGSAVGREDGDFYLDLATCGRLVGHFGLHPDRGGGGCGDERGPRLKMNRGGREQAHVAVNAGAGIPAGGGLLRVIGADREQVRPGCAEVQVTGQIVPEGHVAVGPLAEMEAVDPNVAVGHHAIEFDGNTPRGIVCRQGESFAIPADAGREECARAAGGILLVERAFDGPVVRNVEPAPGTVHEIGLLGAGSIGFEEPPVAVEGGHHA